MLFLPVILCDIHNFKFVNFSLYSSTALQVFLDFLLDGSTVGEEQPALSRSAAGFSTAAKRRASIFHRGLGTTYNRSRLTPPASGASGIHLLSIPQIDAIQRTLRLMDVRLQHIQAGVGGSEDEAKMRDDVDRMHFLTVVNQNALESIVTVLSAIQEEVRCLSISVHQQRRTSLQMMKSVSASRLSTPCDKRRSDKQTAKTIPV